MSIFNKDKYLDIYNKGYELYRNNDIKINKINDNLYQGLISDIIIYLDLNNIKNSSCSLCGNNLCPHIVSVYFKCVKNAKDEYLTFLNGFIKRHEKKQDDMDDDFLMMMTMMDDDEEGDV